MTTSIFKMGLIHINGAFPLPSTEIDTETTTDTDIELPIQSWPGGGGYPIQSWSGGYPPCPDMGWGNPPPPIQTWNGVPPPLVEVWTDTQSENITFPHLSDAGSKNARSGKNV